MPEPTLPKYNDLPVIAATDDRYSWGLFGKGDQLGTINLLTPECVLRAARLVRKGRVFNLSLPLDQPKPPLSQQRQGYRHEVFAPSRNSLDDRLDNFYLQSSSQWDGLRHIRYREFGFYNGFQQEDIERGALGIERLAEHGIIGRGVLLDIPRCLGQQGTPLDASQDVAFDESLLDAVLKAQRIHLERGDIVLLRTGWMRLYLGWTPEERAQCTQGLGPHGMASPGLKATREVAAWLWDRGIAAVAADNPTVEDAPGNPEIGFLHRRLIPLLGMPLGELWNFEELAEDCAADRVYECMVVSVPLNLPGGVGSPANAIALK